MKNLVILQGDSHASNETYSGEYNNSGDSDVLLVLVHLVILLHLVILVNLVNLLILAILLISVKILIILVNLVYLVIMVNMVILVNQTSRNVLTHIIHNWGGHI